MPLTPSEAETALASAIDLALQGNAPAAMERLRRIQSRWPEWDRPWIAHGLLLKEAKRAVEASSMFRTAAALGAREDLSACATLREWASGGCRK